jgi:predicted O-linked N-acetylglucosamine transferase (SPINDLY family)
MAESILSQAGFPQWVAPDKAQFLALARTLAKELAEALRGMWRVYCHNTA